MKKKILASLLTLALVVSMTACGGGSTSSSDTSPVDAASTADSSAPAGDTAEPVSTEKVKLTYWCLFSGGDGDIMKAMVDKYNSGDNKAEIEMTILKSEEYYSKLITAMATKDAPDVAASHLSSVQEFVTEGYIYPMDTLATDAGLQWNEFTEKLNQGVTFDGTHFAVPLDTHVFLLHYNTKILGDMGLLDADSKPNYASGKDNFLAYFQDVKSKLGTDMMPISGTSKNELPLYLWYTLYTQQGGEILSADGATATLDNDKNLAALSFIKQIVDENIWPKNQNNGSEIFTAQTAAATFNGNWGIPIFEKTEGLEFVSLPFPQLFEKQSVYADSHTLILPVQKTEDAAKQAAGMDFANWMADNTVMWAQAGHIPSKTAVVESAEFKALPYRSDYAQSAEWATFYPKSTKITGMKASFTRILASLIGGEYTPEAAMALMQEDMTRLLEE